MKPAFFCDPMTETQEVASRGQTRTLRRNPCFCDRCCRHGIFHTFGGADRMLHSPAPHDRSAVPRGRARDRLSHGGAIGVSCQNARRRPLRWDGTGRRE
jgi:hypothetical protein